MPMCSISMAYSGLACISSKFARGANKTICIPITFNNPLKACLSNMKYILQS